MNEINSLESLLKACLTPTEYQALIKHKSFMEGLASGKRKPKTEGQVDFLKSLQQGSEPSTEFEILWFRYKALKNIFDRLHENKEKYTKAIENLEKRNLQLSNLASVLREQVYVEKNLRNSLEEKLRAYNKESLSEKDSGTGYVFSYFCNACGSYSCRCGQ